MNDIEYLINNGYTSVVGATDTYIKNNITIYKAGYHWHIYTTIKTVNGMSINITSQSPIGVHINNENMNAAKKLLINNMCKLADDVIAVAEGINAVN